MLVALGTPTSPFPTKVLLASSASRSSLRLYTLGPHRAGCAVDFAKQSAHAWVAVGTSGALAVAAARRLRSSLRCGMQEAGSGAPCTKYGPRSCRVAVIGGGPAGVVSGRFLAEAGHDPVILESGTSLGGIWAPEPTNPVVYRGLVTNIPQACMQSFDLDFPKQLPSYITGADLGQYVVDYAQHFNLNKFVRFGTKVIQVQALRTEEEEALGETAWRVSWCTDEGTKNEAINAEDFDAVVVATGHYETPYEPTIPGQAVWLAASPTTGARKVVHSRSYKVPEEYASQVVLVVGGRSSAVDIARELRGVAHWVYVLEKGCQAVRQVGECTHVPLGTELGEDGQLRINDEVVSGPPVEVLMLATGYEYTFPFLDAEHLGLDFGPARRFMKPLYMHISHVRRPSLCLMGIPLAVPCPIPLFEAQARFVAARLCRQEPTGLAEEASWVASRASDVGERQQDLHFLSDAAWIYMKELVRLSGTETKDFEAYCRRLDIVREIYADRGTKRPKLPWDDDWYRRCEYSVDWETGQWQVSCPEDGAEKLNALL